MRFVALCLHLLRQTIPRDYLITLSENRQVNYESLVSLDFLLCTVQKQF